jgi:hypothetical protein
MRYLSHLTSPGTLLRILVILVGLCIALISRTDTAQSQHWGWFWLDNDVANPNGSQSNSGNLFGANNAWILANTQLGICNDWDIYNYNSMPQGIRDAVTAWENVFGGTQMSAGCGVTGYGLAFWRRTVTSGFPGYCVEFVACVQEFLAYDNTRKAYYANTYLIWFNNLQFPNFTDTGWKATAAHELGHVFGLGEQYIEGANPPSSIVCSGADSVMDALSLSGGSVVGGCSGHNLPTSTDVSRVGGFHYLIGVQSSMTHPHGYHSSGGGYLHLLFNNLAYVETAYTMSIQKCCPNGQIVNVLTVNDSLAVGKRDDPNVTGQVLKELRWYRGSQPPNYFYRMCTYTYNVGAGFQNGYCHTPWYYMQ